MFYTNIHEAEHTILLIFNWGKSLRPLTPDST